HLRLVAAMVVQIGLRQGRADIASGQFLKHVDAVIRIGLYDEGAFGRDRDIPAERAQGVGRPCGLPYGSANVLPERYGEGRRIDAEDRADVAILAAELGLDLGVADEPPRLEVDRDHIAAG